VASSRARLAVIVASAAALRLSGIGWDGWHHQHPDERFLVMVAEQLALPPGIGAALDPARTPANPNNAGFDFYVYGALPPDLTALAASALGLKSYSGLLLVGRLLAVGLDLVSLWLVVVLARRLAGERAAVLAGTLYATCGLLIQQSRFGTCDVWGVACVLAVAVAVVGRPPRVRDVVAGGVALGLAVACKPNLALAAVIPLVAVGVAAGGPDRGPERSAWRRIGRAAGTLVLAGAAAFVTLKLADPGAFASLASPLPSPRRLAALRQLASLSNGAGQFPPNLQWADRRALLDPLASLLVWGTGPALGLAILLSLGQRLRRAALGEVAWLPVLAWVLPMSAWHLSRFVCSVRYFEPMLPFAIVAAGALLARVRRRALATATLAASALWGVLWASIAWQPYTRVAASRWLGANLRPGALVTSEYWDDALPIPGEGADLVQAVEIPVFAPDTVEKREQLLDTLDRVDAVVLSSQRGVGTICRVPDAYPLTSEYYHLLFSGALGFERVATFERRLGVGALSLSDLAAEESLSVYDHPPVWIFRKTAAYSPALARSLLERVELPLVSAWDTADLEARGQPPYRERGAGASALPGGLAPGVLRQTLAVVLWLVVVELAGLAGGRLIRLTGASLPDGGWGLARWLGLAAAGLLWLWLGWAGVPGWNGWLPAVAVVAAAPWGVRELRRVWRQREFRVAAAVAWAVLAVFLAIRAGNPEVYWGEKPMDSAILASTLRADSLPPTDAWFAGAPLNYYYVGFLPFSFVARATGTPLATAFNLAVATVPALTAGCALSLGWLLAARPLGGVLAALLAQLTGTLGVLFHRGFLLHPDFNTFWATTRLIETTVNEYPVWTALFADLHAHFLGFPGFLAGVTLASALALRRVPLAGGTLAAGAVIGMEAMTNTWEVPVLVGLTVVAALLRPLAPSPRRRLARSLSHLAGAGLLAAVVSLPYWTTVRLPAAWIALTRVTAGAPAAYLELFGVFAALALVCVAATAVGPSPRAPVVWAWWLVLVGAALVWAPELVTIADRMNTVFKLHLQAHLLLGAALGGLLAATIPTLARPLRAVLTGAAAAAIAVGLATSAADARAVLATRRVPGPRPTLDGARYMSDLDPGQAAVLASLAVSPAAGVAIEPPGTPYSDTMRVPMFTGWPGVVGWEYHLWQRNHAYAEIRLRQQDLQALLAGGDKGLVAALARRYRVRAACGWDGLLPEAAALPGWRVVVERAGATLAVMGRGGEP
jgi:uncharacterized membrane protein